MTPALSISPVILYRSTKVNNFFFQLFQRGVQLRGTTRVDFWLFRRTCVSFARLARLEAAKRQATGQQHDGHLGTRDFRTFELLRSIQV